MICKQYNYKMIEAPHAGQFEGGLEISRQEDLAVESLGKKPVIQGPRRGGIVLREVKDVRGDFPFEHLSFVGQIGEIDLHGANCRLKF